MSPRKERYQTSPYIAQAIRDKRKKMMHGSYYCPKCGLEKLCIAIDKNSKEVIASCTCGLEHQLVYVSASNPIALSQLVQQVETRDMDKSKKVLDRATEAVLQYAKIHFV